MLRRLPRLMTSLCCLLLVAGLATPLATVSRVGAQTVPLTAQGELTCDDFATQEAAQVVLDVDDTFEDALDPDGDGVACDELPSRDDAPDDDADADDADDADRNEPDDVREPIGLGSDLEAFEDVVGPATNDEQASYPDGFEYEVDGFDTFNAYVDEEVEVVIYLTLEPDGSLDPDEALDLVEPYLPADYEFTDEAIETEDGDLLSIGESEALADAVDDDLLEIYAIPGDAGQFTVLYQVNRRGVVTGIEVALGDGSDLAGDLGSRGEDDPDEDDPEERSTPRTRTDEPEDDADLDPEDEAFLEELGENVDTLVESCATFIELFNDPEDTEAWADAVLAEWELWAELEADAGDLEASEDFAFLQEQYVDATGGLIEAIDLFAAGDEDSFQDGIDLFNESYDLLLSLDIQLEIFGF